jgi:hypothetical protein
VARPRNAHIDAAKQPKVVGGPERIDRAVKIMKLLRQMLSYGAAAELIQSALRISSQG